MFYSTVIVHIASGRLEHYIQVDVIFRKLENH